MPQTGKIIKVKKTTFRVLFFRSPRGWRFCFGLHGSIGCLRSAGDPHRHGRKRAQTFLCIFFKQNSCQFVCVIMHNFTNLMCIFFAGLTRTATKIGGDLLPHPQTPFMKTELRFHSFLSRHCSFSVPPSLAPKLPMRHDPVDDRNDLHVDGRPPS